MAEQTNVIEPQIIDVAPVQTTQSGKKDVGERIPPSSTVNTLNFNALTFVSLEDGLHPRIVCPVCKKTWTPQLVFGTLTDGDYDFNDLVAFTFPDHDDCLFSGQTISWFVAVHRDGNGTVVCMQKSTGEGADGISENLLRTGERI
jgi:hypothetical protein